MAPFGRRRRPRFDAHAFDSVLEGAKSLYFGKVRPLEAAFLVETFHYPLLNPADLDAKPMVMLIGQYSTGKTSFIRYLLEGDFPGMHVGPQPTTDKWHAIMYGEQTRELPGNALASNPDAPFFALSRQFGNAFLSKFCGCEVPSQFARGCTLIDTPGILAGKKQTEDRLYSFENVVSWFAPRVDLILLMFDAHKVDISDEFRRVIESLQGYDDKVRVVMNKADSLAPAELLRVNSALSWSLSRILRSPEVRRVYVGSFWEQPLDPSNFLCPLFETEATRLLRDLAEVPRQSTLNKISNLVARARTVRVQALILSQLKSEMPKILGGRDRKQRELIAGLEDVFFKVMRAHQIPAGDFPDVNKFRHTLATHEACRDFTKFKKLDAATLAALNQLISSDVSMLMARFDAIPAGGLLDADGSSPTPGRPTAPGYAPAAPPHADAVPPVTTDPWSTAAAGGEGSTASCSVAGSPPRGQSPAAPYQAEPARTGPSPESARDSVAGSISDPWATGGGNASASGRVTPEASIVDGLFARSGKASGVPEQRTVPWVVTEAEKAKYDAIFQQLEPEGGRAPGAKVAPVLRRSAIPNEALKHIWNLCDVGGRGSLDADWFAVAMHLTVQKKRGVDVPQSLPLELIPPSART